MNQGLSAPIFDGDLNGHAVRYFTSPIYRAHRQPDMPWHSVDDLWPVLMPGWDTATAFEVLKQQMRKDWREPRTVATAGGIVTIAPHFMAEGLFEAILGLSNGPQESLIKLRGRYRNCCTQALKVMTAHMGPVQRMLFAIGAR